MYLGTHVDGLDEEDRGLGTRVTGRLTGEVRLMDKIVHDWDARPRTPLGRGPEVRDKGGAPPCGTV